MCVCVAACDGGRETEGNQQNLPNTGCKASDLTNIASYCDDTTVYINRRPSKHTSPAITGVLQYLLTTLSPACS